MFLLLPSGTSNEGSIKKLQTKAIMFDRVKAKSWFTQLYKEQPTFVVELINYYAEKHSKECKEFLKSFRAAFNYLAAPRRIPKVR